VILLNGKLLNAEAATVSPLGEGFQFGVGVFTTMRVQDGRPQFFQAHAERLVRDARALGLEVASEPSVLAERCAACIAVNRIDAGGLKIVWFADAGGRTGEIISQRPYSYGPELAERGFRLTTRICASRENHELSRHKTLNYLDHLHAKRAAAAAGFDDALWVDERGIVLEGATTNVFAVIDGRIFTPDEKAGLLPGVGRRVVLELTVEGLERARPMTLTRELLAGAAEVFVTNSLIGVVPVRSWDERNYSLVKNPVTRAMAAAFAAAASQ
jgi:branched-subunit amino acid aminotransferase/4-amino-4-deoxychorismate lyase